MRWKGRPSAAEWRIATNPPTAHIDAIGAKKRLEHDQTADAVKPASFHISRRWLPGHANNRCDPNRRHDPVGFSATPPLLGGFPPLHLVPFSEGVLVAGTDPLLTQWLLFRSRIVELLM